ncbi:MAG: PqqD family peptide modification chaperone [Oscillospiraceae bacterium]|nr:PqqD family peptide modification chaperone [Oscillospiraceae bacterium]
MRLSKDFITHSAGGENYVVSTGNSSFNGMIKQNDTAFFITNCLKEEITEDGIVSKMLETYDVDEDTARQAVRDVVESLRSVGAIVEKKEPVKKAVKMGYEEYFEDNEHFTGRFRGVSMMPLLRQKKDVFIARRKGSERCQKYDVVLYRRNGRYILHRIVEVRPNDYVIRGDNCLANEYGITDSDILAVMTGFIRGGREHSTDELWYRAYSRIHCAIFPVRKIYMKLRRLGGRVLRKLGLR